MKKTNYKILNNINIKNPCHENWDTMTGDNKKKFCNKCSKHVSNLSELTEYQAVKLLSKTRNDICVRYQANKEGKIIFKPSFSFKNLKQICTMLLLTTFTLFGFPNYLKADDEKVASDNSQEMKMGEIDVRPSTASSPEPTNKDVILGKIKVEPSKE